MLISMPHHVVNSCTTFSKVCIPSGVSAKIEMSSISEVKIACIITRKRNNVAVLCGTLKVQSFMLTEMRDCDKGKSS